MRKDYIPNWYIEKIEKKEIKYYKSLTFSLIFIVLIMAGFAMKNISTYNNLMFESINKLSTKKDTTQDAVEKNIDINTLKYLQEKIINTSINLDKITIDKNTISMIIDVKDMNDYLVNIKHLEANSDIIYVSNIMEKEKQKFFEVKVKIKNEKY